MARSPTAPVCFRSNYLGRNHTDDCSELTAEPNYVAQCYALLLLPTAEIRYEDVMRHRTGAGGRIVGTKTEMQTMVHM
uniref:Uncharacterized protein n=1 Tax=Anopheles dirus TaxID=7168 RepID=A0A182N6P5_9DIPT